MSKFHNPIYEKDRWAANRSKAFLIAVLSVNSVIAVIRSEERRVWKKCR